MAAIRHGRRVTTDMGEAPCSKRLGLDDDAHRRLPAACCSSRRPSSTRSPRRSACRCRACGRSSTSSSASGCSRVRPRAAIGSSPLRRRSRCARCCSSASADSPGRTRRSSSSAISTARRPSSASVADVVDVVLGADAVRQRLGQLQAAAIARCACSCCSEVALVERRARTSRRTARWRAACATASSSRAPCSSARVPRPPRARWRSSARRSACCRRCRRACSSPTTRWRCSRCARTATTRASGALLVHPSGLLDLVDLDLRGVLARGDPVLSMTARRRRRRGGRPRPAEAPAAGADGCRGRRAARHLAAHRAAPGRRAHGARGRDDAHPARRRGRAPRLGLISRFAGA